jgi:hypothetical protein
MRRPSTKMPTSAPDGASAGSVYGSPPARRVSLPRCRSPGATGTTRVRCGCGLTRAPTAATPSTCCGA